jgi:hypothetical protein
MDKNKWISVKDHKMPDRDIQVLAYSGGTYLPVEIAFWECGYGLRTVYGRNSLPLVTHWMPLPEPPEDK